MQYPLPAMNKDESSINGTIDVLETIDKNLGMKPGKKKKHGLCIAHGDLLSM